MDTHFVAKELSFHTLEDFKKCWNFCFRIHVKNSRGWKNEGWFWTVALITIDIPSLYGDKTRPPYMKSLFKLRC